MDSDIGILKAENIFLRQIITELASDNGYNFCYSCYNYGKADKFNIRDCILCNQKICDNCVTQSDKSDPTDLTDPTDNSDLTDPTDPTYCESCYEHIKDMKRVTLTLNLQSVNTNVTNNIPLMNWEQFDKIFVNRDRTIDYIVDIINDQFENGNNYQYELNVLNTFENTTGCYIQFYFDLTDPSDDPDSSVDELVDELMSYLYEIDGFCFDPDSEYINPGSIDKEIILDLS